LVRDSSVPQANSAVGPDRQSSAEESPSVLEQDAHLQICEEMSRWRSSVSSPTQLGRSTLGREVLEYHGGVNPITILGQVLGKNRPRRLVRIFLKDSESSADQVHALPNVDPSDMEYLQRKGAFNLPPSRTWYVPHSAIVMLKTGSHKFSEKFLQLYFECVYPYAPILNRVQFMQEYMENKHSMFLIQSIFANVVPYTPASLLLEAGFSDRLVAQKSFFSKAKLLYDFGCEMGQLQLLQGSLMLSSLSFQYAVDSDFRFWLSNAVRIATQMGLHRNNMARDLDSSTRKLLRRIWWVLYNRDILLTVSGLDNIRRLQDSDCDTAMLTEADWDEREIPQRFQVLLPHLPRLQKTYVVENCKLSVISES
jgi:hypothetical protein